jgi:hypothetical protein
VRLFQKDVLNAEHALLLVEPVRSCVLLKHFQPERVLSPASGHVDNFIEHVLTIVLAGLGRIEVELVEENAPLVRFRKHGVPGHFHESHWPIGFCHKPGNMALGQALLNDGRGILGVQKILHLCI